MKTGELVNFWHEVQNELLLAYRALKDPYYTYQATCPACVAAFLTTIYKWYDTSNSINKP